MTTKNWALIAAGVFAGALLHGVAGRFGSDALAQGSSNNTFTTSTSSGAGFESPPTCNPIGSSRAVETITLEDRIGPDAILVGNRDTGGTVFPVPAGTSNTNVNVHTQTFGCVAPITSVPIVLSSGGLVGSFFTSELALTNRGTTAASIAYSYTAAFGGASGTATDSLPAGRQKIVTDGITYLRNLGIQLGDSGNRGGTLQVSFGGLSSPDAAAATVRTTTAVAEGRAGLAYAGLRPPRLLGSTVYLCGLRQNATDRSNVAVLHAGPAFDGSITLRLTVVSGDPLHPTTQALPDITLSPGGFNQVSGILESNGLSVTNGYVRVEKVSGTAPFYAYAVINDQANSDGSFVEPVLAIPAVAVPRLTLPVIVETGAFSTELVFTNFTAVPRTLRATYAASALPSGSVTFTITLLPFEQQILPGFVQVLRDRGIISGSPGATFAGALFVTDVLGATGDLRGVSVGARTSNPGGGGRYGLFYSAVAGGSEATTSAWLYALQQNVENRTNLAIAVVGSTNAQSDTFHIDLYDGATGLKAGFTDVTVPANGFTQINTIFATFAPGVASGYAKITRTAAATRSSPTRSSTTAASPGREAETAPSSRRLSRTEAEWTRPTGGRAC